MDWLDTDPALLLDDVLDAKVLGGEDIDEASPDVRRHTLQEIERAQHDIRSCLRCDDSGRVIVHRYIDAAPESFDPDVGIGECWSFDRAGAHGYAAKRTRGGLVITAAVSFSDLVGPACLAFWESGETEARLDVQANVEILAVHVGDCLVREDLTGRLAAVAQTSAAFRPRF